MFDDMLKRKDVQILLNDICNSECYYNKKMNKSMDYHLFTDVEEILFLFYDALFKYKIIIDDMSYFQEYLEQIDKLIRKIDNFKDISLGISRILTRICALKLNIKDLDSPLARKNIIKYMHKAYIEDGYYIHGFATVYTDAIKEQGFASENYINLYPEFIKIQNILNKYGNGNILDKDFGSREIFLTNSFVMGCYYSVNAPMFFYKLLCKNNYITKKKDVDCYLKGDYKSCYNNLSRLCNKLQLRDKEKSIFLDTFNNEWKLLKKENSKISIMLVPRKLIDTSDNDYSKYLDSESSIFNLVDKMINSRNNNIKFMGYLDVKNIIFVELDYYKIVKTNDKVCVSDKNYEISFDEYAFSNDYGKVSILLLVGSLFITLGVIITIINVLGGF